MSGVLKLEEAIWIFLREIVKMLSEDAREKAKKNIDEALNQAGFCGDLCSLGRSDKAWIRAGFTDLFHRRYNGKLPERRARATELRDIILRSVMPVIDQSLEERQFDEKLTECVEPLLTDLVEPVLLTADQMQRFAIDFKEGWDETKDNIFSNRQKVRLCPVCNNPFQRPNPALAAVFGEGSKVFYKRFPGGKAALDNVHICSACELEYSLRFLLLGSRAQNVAMFFPHRNTTPTLGEVFGDVLSKVDAGFLRASSCEAEDVTKMASLRDTAQITKSLLNVALDQLPSVAEDIAMRIVRNRSSAESRNKQIRDLVEKIENEGQDVESINKAYGTDYSNLEQVAAGILNGDALKKGLDREWIVSLRRSIGIPLRDINASYFRGLLTPNFILVPLAWTQDFDYGVSDTDSAHKRVFASILLAYLTNSQVAIVSEQEEPPLRSSGVAWIPPKGHARALYRGKFGAGDWIPFEIAEQVFRACGLAAVIAEYAELSDRSGIHQVLETSTAGELLRRLEMKLNGSLGFSKLREAGTFVNILQKEGVLE